MRESIRLREREESRIWIDFQVPAAGRREHHIVWRRRELQSTSNPAPRFAQDWHANQPARIEVYVAKTFVVKNGKRQVKLFVGNRKVEISNDEIRSKEN